jgi:hypothetical protein
MLPVLYTAEEAKTKEGIWTAREVGRRQSVRAPTSAREAELTYADFHEWPRP